VQFAFSSERKMMTTVVELSPGGPVRVFVTGGSDTVLTLSSHMLRLPDAPPPAGTQSVPALSSPPVREALSPAAADALVADVIVNMARQSLRTLGLAYRDFDSAASLPFGWEDAPAALEQGVTLYAILGIKDPLRKVRGCKWCLERGDAPLYSPPPPPSQDVSASIAQVQAAGVTVRMVTGDNKITAAAIAEECGILHPGGLVLEGPEFRRVSLAAEVAGAGIRILSLLPSCLLALARRALSPAQVDELLPILCVLARSSPRDKNLLVRRLNGAAAIPCAFSSPSSATSLSAPSREPSALACGLGGGAPWRFVGD